MLNHDGKGGDEMKFLTRSFWVAIVFFAVAGCGHYQLGRPSHSKGNEPIQVWIAPVMMEEVIAEVAIPLNRELREQVVRNRSLRLVESRQAADKQLWVTVTSRERNSLARRSKDTGLSDVLRLELIAVYSLKSSDSTVSKSGEVSVEGQVFRDPGFNESARQRMPAMLRDLADDILQEAFLDW